MESLLSEVWLLALIIFVIALAYSSVGLGGGSAYTALMSIVGMSTVLIPLLSLMLNTLVTTVGSYNFWRLGHVRFSLILPFLLTSFPFAYLGGMTNLPVEIFNWILLLCLSAIAVRIYGYNSIRMELRLSPWQQRGVALFGGALLGFLSGSIGIGGGIFLVPLITVLGLGDVKQAAACGVIFTWLNSISGLVARLQFNHVEWLNYWPLFVAAITGGLIGSLLGANKFSASQMERVLGIIIVLAIIILLRRLLFAG